jgi:hypothetical protein
VGFIEGGTPWQPKYYLPKRIIEFLQAEVLQQQNEVAAIPGL